MLFAPLANGRTVENSRLVSDETDTQGSRYDMIDEVKESAELLVRSATSHSMGGLILA